MKTIYICSNPLGLSFKKILTFIVVANNYTSKNNLVLKLLQAWMGEFQINFMKTLVIGMEGVRDNRC